MDAPTATPTARCTACGAELTDAGATWCPRCGAALLTDKDGWDVAPPAERRRGVDPTGGADPSSGAGPEAAAPRRAPRWPRAWPRRLRSRRAVILVIAAAAVVIAAAASLGGVLTARSAAPEVLFAVTAPDRSGRMTVGYIDKRGAVVIPTGSFFACGGSEFSQGLAPVFVADKAGYIDFKGRVVIQPRFEMAGSFHEGRAWVTSQVDVAYIDTRGSYVIPHGLYTFGSDFSEGLAAVSITEKDGTIHQGYVDRNGALVIAAGFETAGDFSEGLAAVSVLRGDHVLYGYIDKNGAWAIEPQFLFADEFSEGYAAVTAGSETSSMEQWGYVDKSGLWLVHPSFSYAGRFSEGLACVSQQSGDGSSLTGYIDRSGAWAISPSLVSGGDFSQGLAPAMPATGAGMLGYINHKGEWVIDPQFVGAGVFSPDGLAVVWLDEQDSAASSPAPWAFMSSISPRVGSLIGGYASAGVSACIDTSGKIVWRAGPAGSAEGPATSAGGAAW